MRHVIESATRKTRYYVCDGVAYDIDTHESKFRVVGVYWYAYPSNDGLPAMIEHKGWLYTYPPEEPPVLHYA